MRLIFLLILVSLLPGCTPAQVDALKADRADAAALIDQAKGIAATLPPDSDAKAKLDAWVIEAEKRLPLLDAAIKTAETGQVDATLTAELAKLPVIGPYANLIMLGGAIGFGIYQRHRKTQYKKGLTQLAAAQDEVLPEPSPAQQNAIDSKLDEDVKVLVAKAKK